MLPTLAKAIAGTVILLALVAGLTEIFPEGPRAGVGEASSSFGAETTPTYVSELAPAVMVGPDGDELPVAGVRESPESEGLPWATIAGAGVAALGLASMYAAFSLRARS